MDYLTILILIIIALTAYLFVIKKKIKLLVKTQKQYEELAYLAKTFMDAAQDIIYLKDENLNYLIINNTLEKLHEKTAEEIIGKNDFELLSEKLAKQIRKKDLDVLAKRSLIVSDFELNDKIYKTIKFPVQMPSGKYGIGTFITEVTKQRDIEKQQEKELFRYKILTEVLTRNFENKQEQLNYVLNAAQKLTESQYGYIFLYDEQEKKFTLNYWTTGVKEDCGIIDKLSINKIDNTGIWGEVVRQRTPVVVNDFQKENPLKKGYPEGHIVINKYMTIPVIIDDRIVATVGLANKINDYDHNDVYQLTLLMNSVWNVIERKEIQENIKYLGFHDPLTDLYNRRFFEEELRRLDTERNLPISIIMGDVNGLKITNDIFGHTYGDALLKKVADVLRKVCRADDIISRNGGDEFVLLLPRTDLEEAEIIISRIKKELSKEQVKFIQCNMSMGAYTKRDKVQSIKEVQEKAEEKMYYAKATEKKELQQKSIQAMVKTLHESNDEEREHSINVSYLCEVMGKKLQLSEKSLQNLKTAGYLHNIGKVAIDQKYLDENYRFKQVVLGYRILNSVDSASELAEAVLLQQENWDGSGYPKGLKGEEIPLNSRIISIVEYYDRNINGYYGNKTLSKEETLSIIKSKAGIKFDPMLIEVFTDILKSHK